MCGCPSTGLIDDSQVLQHSNKSISIGGLDSEKELLEAGLEPESDQKDGWFRLDPRLEQITIGTAEDNTIVLNCMSTADHHAYIEKGGSHPCAASVILVLVRETVDSPALL